MKTLATFVLCLSLLAGFTACDKDDDNMGTLIVEIRDNAKASVLNIYTEEGSLIYTNTEYLYQNDPRSSIPLNPGNYRLESFVEVQRLRFPDSGRPARPPSITPTTVTTVWSPTIKLQ